MATDENPGRFEDCGLSQENLRRLDAAISRGIADADAGRVQSVAAVFERLEAKYQERKDQ